ncbi:MAG: dihydromonapterin reductase [Halothiobacillaceae bacterium]|nr:MAG: dihydromonapterin reductase [Halothiobacillaceae bacterium]
MSCARARLRDAVLLTGGGQRLGLYHAERFLDQGTPLIVSYRTERPAIERLRARGARVLQADLSSPEGIDALVAAVRNEAESLRAIIHNASVWLTDEDVRDDPAGFDMLMNLHVRAPWRINMACAELLRATSATFADVIHITDTSVRKGSSQRTAYVASKAALESLTLSFSAKFAPRIKVNSIAPGLIMFNEGDDEAYRQDRLSSSALGFEPGPDVVWQAIRFLMDNPYITGASLPVDGGRNVK